MAQKTLLDRPAEKEETQEGQGILYAAAELLIISLSGCAPKKE